MLGMRRGKTPRPIFLKIGTHKFGHDVMNPANFGEISFSGFGNPEVQITVFPLTMPIGLTTMFPLPWEPVITVSKLMSHFCTCHCVLL